MTIKTQGLVAFLISFAVVMCFLLLTELTPMAKSQSELEIFRPIALAIALSIVVGFCSGITPVIASSSDKEHKIRTSIWIGGCLAVILFIAYGIADASEIQVISVIAIFVFSLFLGLWFSLKNRSAYRNLEKKEMRLKIERERFQNSELYRYGR